MVNLTKQESVDLIKKSTINLKKSMEVKKVKPGKKRVCVFLDKSISMDKVYIDGRIKRTLLRILPIGNELDDNEEVDFGIFHDKAFWLTPVTMQNFYTYQEDYIDNIPFGGTYYATALEKIYQRYVVEDPSDTPTLAIIITDGETANKREVTKWIIRLSFHNIFIKFLGLKIWKEKFEYLMGLDHFKKSYPDIVFLDNVDFKEVSDIVEISDDELYDRVLDEYDSWETAYRYTPKKPEIVPNVIPDIPVPNVIPNIPVPNVIPNTPVPNSSNSTSDGNKPKGNLFRRLFGK